MKKGEKKLVHSPDHIRDISEKVYRSRLEQDCPGNVDRMLKKDHEKDADDNGKKLRGRAHSYDGLTRIYIDVLGIKP